MIKFQEENIAKDDEQHHHLDSLSECVSKERDRTRCSFNVVNICCTDCTENNPDDDDDDDEDNAEVKKSR